MLFLNPLAFSQILVPIEGEGYINGPTLVIQGQSYTYSYENHNLWSVSWVTAGGNVTSTWGGGGMFYATIQWTASGLQSLSVQSVGSLYAAISISVSGTIQAPSALAANQITSNSFNARWSSVSGAQSYRLDVATTSNFSSMVPGYSNLSVSGTNRVVTGLNPNTTYYYRVRAVASGGTVSSNSNTRTVVTAPQAPVALSPTNILAYSFRARWQSASGAASYQLQVATNANFFGATTFSNISTLNRLINNLLPNTDYFYRVRAVSSSGVLSSYSQTISVKTQAELNISNPINITSTSFDIGWANPFVATGFLLDVATSPSFTGTYLEGYQDKEIPIGHDLLMTWHTVENLNPSTTYYCRVRAVTSFGVSTYSETRIVTTGPPPPIALQASEVQSHSFKANWTAVPMADSYDLQVSSNSSFSIINSIENISTVEYVVNNNVLSLSPFSTYYYRVRAKLPGSASSYSDPISVTTLPFIGPLFGPSNITNNSFTVSWNNVNGADYYELQVSTSADFSGFILINSNIPNGPGGTTQHTVTGLNSNTNYYFRLRASSPVGWAISETYYTKTAPPPPVATQASNIQDNSFTANWQSVPGADYYQLQVSLDPEFSNVLLHYNNIVVLGGTSRLVTSLTKNTNYYYRVRAVSNGVVQGYSDYSNVIEAKTFIGVPTPAPANYVTSRSFIANWEPEEGADHYLLYLHEGSNGGDSHDDYFGIQADENFYVIKGLVPQLNYSYRIKAVAENGQETPFSDYMNVQTAPSGQYFASITSKTYSKDENQDVYLSGISKSYINGFGEGFQSQWKDMANNQVWAQQSIYDSKGMPTLFTLPAPILSQHLNFKDGLIFNSQGVPYSEDDFDKEPTLEQEPGELFEPLPAGSQKPGTVGWYYSQNNNMDQEVPKTSFPFSRQWIAPGPSPKKAIQSGPGESFKMGSGQEMVSEERLVNASQLDHYYDLAQSLDPVWPNQNLGSIKMMINFVKHGMSPVAFYDKDENLIATAMAVTDGDQIVSYDFWSYYYYNKTGQLIREVPPLGVDITSNDPPAYYIQYEYDHLGRMIKVTHPDEGEVEYVFSYDGMVRFSQSSLQKAATPQRFSYTEYDDLGRPVEVGEYHMEGSGHFVFEGHNVTTPHTQSVLPVADLLGSAGHLDPGNKAAMMHIYYDFEHPEYIGNTDFPNQNINTGEISMTENEHSKTWYSYDEFGRMEWMKRDIEGFGAYWVAYTYDYEGKVLEVKFSPEIGGSFTHYYSYDLNGRLTEVSTSYDGQTPQKNAGYEYYFHGPLKHVEIGNYSHGMDFEYTLNGWLKSAKHQSGGPGTQPTPPAFRQTFHYYEGDDPLDNGSIPYWTHGESRYDGLPVVMEYGSALDGSTNKGWEYEYEGRNQLSKGKWGSMENGDFVVDPAGKYTESVDGYDAHGNITGLSRKDETGQTVDDFTYIYAANSNKLMEIQNHGQPWRSYEYNVEGAVTKIMEDGEEVTLDYYPDGLIKHITMSEDDVEISYVYDEMGFLLKRCVTADEAPQICQWYISDLGGNLMASYLQEEGSQPVAYEMPVYGLGKAGTYRPQEDAYFYVIDDHQGNVRAVLGEVPDVEFKATMEQVYAEEEESFFGNIAETRQGYYNPFFPERGNYVSRLDQYQMEGPFTVMQVWPGDEIRIEGYAYHEQSASSSSSNYLNLMAGFLSQMFTGWTGVAPDILPGQGEFYEGLNAAGLPASWNGHNEGYQGLLGYILFNESLDVTDAGFMPVETPDNFDFDWEHLDSGPVSVTEAGFLYVFTVHMNQQNIVLLFDDISVTVAQSPILVVKDYYPFGMEMPGRGLELEKYGYGYQGAYAEYDSLLSLNRFQLRMYDPRTGRWLSADPYGQYNSPYVGMGNLPHFSIDPDGGFNLGATVGGALAGFGIGSLFGLAVDKDNWWKYGVGGAVLGGVAGASVGDINISQNVGGWQKFKAEFEFFFTGKERTAKIWGRNSNLPKGSRRYVKEVYKFGPGEKMKEVVLKVIWEFVENESWLPIGIINGINGVQDKQVEITNKGISSQSVTDQDGNKIISTQPSKQIANWKNGKLLEPEVYNENLPKGTTTLNIHHDLPVWIDENGVITRNKHVPYKPLLNNVKNNIKGSSRKFSKHVTDVRVIAYRRIKTGSLFIK